MFKKLAIGMVGGCLLLAGSAPPTEPPGLGVQQAGPTALWTSSRLQGSPEPARPYVVQRAFDKLPLDWPICVRAVPGTRFFLAINEGSPYAPAQLLSFVGDPNVDQVQVQFAFPGVAYDIAFHPHFAENRFVFIGSHQPDHPGGPHCCVTRYRVRLTPDQCLVDPESAVSIIQWESNGHNGAALAFGLDGMLYVTSGDGTVTRDTNEVGQRLDTLLAKVLRIDVDHPEPDRNYSIPPDNPFRETPGARGETWCYGLRNPWRIAVDSESGQIWVGNNGQDAWEQIYLIDRGANYGWSVYEGSHVFILERTRGPTPISGPAFEHPHAEARSMTGGVVYHGQRFADLQGDYVYGDYSTGKIWAGKHDGSRALGHRELVDTTLNITCFTEDHQGELLICDHRGDGKGGLYRLAPNPAFGNKAAAFPQRLSETGLFLSVVDHRLAPGVLEYSLQAPAWHDGARVERFLGAPASHSLEGRPELPQLGFRVRGKWEFPEGCVLAQTLSWPLVSGGRRRLETRVLLKDQGEWTGYSYVWNDQQTDAVLAPAEGQRIQLHDIDSTALDRFPNAATSRVWQAPSRTECMACHSRAADYVLGWSTEQLNRQHAYAWGQENQLQLLELLGLIGNLAQARAEADSPPAALPQLLDPLGEGLLQERARTYLDVNCAHCHVPDGGGNARIVLSRDVSLSEMNAVDAAPMHGGYALQEPAIIKPGLPQRSLLVYRLASLGGGRMPRVGSHAVDAAGLQLIWDWIASLPPTPSQSPPSQSPTPAASAVAEQATVTAADATPQDASQALLQIQRMQQLPSGDSMQRFVRQGATHPEPAIRDLFERFLPEDQRVQRLGAAPDPQAILMLSGDANRGRSLFHDAQTLACRSCHRIAGQGRSVGPDLDGVGKKYDLARLLEQILEPSKTVEEKHQTYLVETVDGRVTTGMKLGEPSPGELAFQDVSGTVTTINVNQIERMQRQPISLMPEHLLKDLTAQQAADLLQYLSTLR